MYRITTEVGGQRRVIVGVAVSMFVTAAADPAPAGPYSGAVVAIKPRSTKLLAAG